MSFPAVGDIARPFALPTDNGCAFDLYGDDIAGRFVALVFCPDGISAAADQLRAFAGVYESLKELAVVVAAVSPEPASVLAIQRKKLGLPFELLSDEERKLLVGYGITTGDDQFATKTVSLLLRPNQHVQEIMRDGLHAEKTMQIVSQHRNRQRETGLGFQPPILMVPDVLTPEDCQRLIDRFDEPGVPVVKFSDLDEADIKGDVKTPVADYDRKDRIDHFITSEELQSHISARLQSRLLPEIKKAFHYTVTSFEALRIGCYQGKRGGRAHGHRDNSLPDVAHRRFAVSINLNGSDFEGGEIRFPEFGPQYYKAQTGAALVFSCSLLHEALAVTRGRRLVLLAFLNGKQ